MNETTPCNTNNSSSPSIKPPETTLPQVLSEKELKSKTGMTLKDTGQRQSWETGAQRDVQTGKGRFDLLPAGALQLALSNLGNTLQTNAHIRITPKTAFETWLGFLGEPMLTGHLIDTASQLLISLENREAWKDKIVFEWDSVEPKVPTRAIECQAKLYEAGCLKYGDRNWEKGIPVSRYCDSGLRHLNKELRGLTDEDHLVAATWNALCCLETIGRVENDRQNSLPRSLLDLPNMVVHPPESNLGRVHSICRK